MLKGSPHVQALRGILLAMEGGVASAKKDASDKSPLRLSPASAARLRDRALVTLAIVACTLLVASFVWPTGITRKETIIMWTETRMMAGARQLRSAASLASLRSVSSMSASTPPVVDWSQFQAHKRRDNKAGVFAEDMRDPGLPFVIRALRSRAYEVYLFVEDGMEHETHGFLFRNELIDRVKVELVQAFKYMINSTNVDLFIYMPLDESTVVAGRGAINWLLFPPGGAAGSNRVKTEAQFARSAKQIKVLPPKGAGKGALHRRSLVHDPLDAPTAQDLALATYDMILYRNEDDCTRHAQALNPGFVRLQSENYVFPIVETLPVPYRDKSDQDYWYESKFDQLLVHSDANKIYKFFVQNTLAAYKARLTPSIQRDRAAHFRAAHGDARLAAVIIVTRPSYSLFYSILNAAWYLPGWTIHVIHSKASSDFLKPLLAHHLDIQYHQLDTDIMTPEGYNAYLKSRRFWEMLDADYVLKFQADSLILQKGAELFTQYDYVGPPWPLEDDNSEAQKELKTLLPEGVGDGGFSLRSTAAMIAIGDEFGRKSAPGEREDIFFSVHVTRHQDYTVADRLSAYQFCMKAPCKDIPASPPMAIHSIWYYLDAADTIRMLDSSLYGLVETYD